MLPKLEINCDMCFLYCCYNLQINVLKDSMRFIGAIKQMKWP